MQKVDLLSRSLPNKNDSGGGGVFVTVGTTEFDLLLGALLEEDTLDALRTKGYDRLVIQLGRGQTLPDCKPLPESVDPFHEVVPSAYSQRVRGVTIQWFRYRISIRPLIESASLVISHAGAGSCLEVLEARKPLLVVVNPTLMGNHQTELADKLASLNHLRSCVPSTLAKSIGDLNIAELKVFPVASARPFAALLDRLMGVEQLYVGQC